MCIILLALVLTSFHLSAQSNFHKGAIILNDGIRLEGEIDYKDWIITPERIKFKQAGGEVKEYSPTRLKAFYVDTEYYISREVDLDVTEQDLPDLHGKINQQSVRKHLFLRVLVNGEASLYSYRNNRAHYFASKGEEPVELLNLRRISNSSLSYYNKYLGQLKVMLSDCLEENRINTVQFRNRSLVKLISDYNDCKGGESDFIVQNKPLKAGLYVIGGYKLTSYEITSGENYTNYQLDTNPVGSYNFGLGLTLEIFRNTGKLQVYNDFLYQQYAFNGNYRNQQSEEQYTDYVLDIDLGYLELTNMIRYFFGRRSAIDTFANLGIVNAFQVSDKSTENYNSYFYGRETLRDREPLDGQIEKHRLFFVLGTGIEVHRFGLEIRYGFKPRLSGYPVISTSANINAILTYRI